MSDTIYHQLQELLDTIPNGFPKSEDGIEIEILKRIFTPEEAEIATKLTLKYETPDAIAERTGMDKDYLSEKLSEMQKRGEIFGVTIGDTSIYRLMPFVLGVFEFQLYRMDKELAELIEKYMKNAFGKEFFSQSPQFAKVIPIETEIPSQSVIEPYESITEIINSAKSWAVAECVCKKEHALLDKKCSKPTEVCLGLAPIENYFDNHFWGRAISKEEAIKVLNTAEEEGLVHMTSNIRQGHIFICNCCSCCCGLLSGINVLGIKDAVATSNYVAVVDDDKCGACEICVERCQVHAITVDSSAVIDEKCIGCGLCVTTCPDEAITLECRDENKMQDIPIDEKEWWDRRATDRNIVEDYKKLT